MHRGRTGFTMVVALACWAVFALAVLGARPRGSAAVEAVPGQSPSKTPGKDQPPGAQPGALPDALKTHLRGERFMPLTSVATLPASVREALRTLFNSKSLELADPGQPFQATDVMVTPRLPARRLVMAGCSADHCLVYYERGGFAHVHQIVLFATSDDTARFLHGGVAEGGLTGLEQVKDALLSDKVSGASKYW